MDVRVRLLAVAPEDRPENHFPTLPSLGMFVVCSRSSAIPSVALGLFRVANGICHPSPFSFCDLFSVGYGNRTGRHMRNLSPWNRRDRGIRQRFAFACFSTPSRLPAPPFDRAAARVECALQGTIGFSRRFLRPPRPFSALARPGRLGARGGIRSRGQFGHQDRRIQPPGRKNACPREGGDELGT